MPIGAAKIGLMRQPPPVGGGLAFLQAAPTPYAAASSLSTHTLSYTAATSGSNRKLIICVSHEGLSTVSSVTYNGQSLTQAVSATDDVVKPTIWYLDHASIPTDGNPHDAVVTLSGGSSANMIFSVMEYEGVAQGAPSTTQGQASNSTNTPDHTLNSVPAGGLIISAVQSGGDHNFSPASGQTERWDSDAASGTGAMAAGDIVGASGGNTFLEWTNNSASPSRQAILAAAWSAA